MKRWLSFQFVILLVFTIWFGYEYWRLHCILKAQEASLIQTEQAVHELEQNIERFKAARERQLAEQRRMIEKLDKLDP